MSDKVKPWQSRKPRQHSHGNERRKRIVPLRAGNERVSPLRVDDDRVSPLTVEDYDMEELWKR